MCTIITRISLHHEDVTGQKHALEIAADSILLGGTVSCSCPAGTHDFSGGNIRISEKESINVRNRFQASNVFF